MAIYVSNPQAPGQVLWRKLGLYIGSWLRTAAFLATGYLLIAGFIFAFGR